MLTILSPAKKLDLTPQKQTKKFTQPEFLDESTYLVKTLRKYSKKKLRELMSISENLAELNHERFEQWSAPFTEKNAKPAIMTFIGEVYEGINVKELKAADLKFAQDHLRILSGLHGVLRPLDLIQPYRLEMGTKLKTRKGKTLYDFWGNLITENLNEIFSSHKHQTLVNLASNEYFKSIQQKELSANVITPIFKEVKDGKSRSIMLYAKRARGRMASWIARNRIDNPDDLIGFNEDDYKFAPKESTDEKLVFSRKQPPPVNG